MSSIGNSDRSLRKFLRSRGVKPSVANMERIGKEVRMTQAEHERTLKQARETKAVLRDAQGSDVHAMRRAEVQRELASRKPR